MSQADDILLALDAYECLGRSTARGPDRVEPNLLPGAADFGMILGQQSIADLQDIMASWSYRMGQLTQAYADFSPAWASRDQAAFLDWSGDFQRLQARYNAAMSAAQSAVTGAKLNFATPNSMIAAQAEYDGLAKAMRQCYPPDGCPIAKGDFDDLDRRLSAARGQQVSYANIPQPKAVDVDQKMLNVSAPADIAAMAAGQQAWKGPIVTLATGVKDLSNAVADLLKGDTKHGGAYYTFMGISIGAGGVVGLKAGAIVGLGPVGLALGLLGGFGLFELISSKTSSAVSGISSKLSTASAVAKHL